MAHPFDVKAKYLGLKLSQWVILYFMGTAGYVIGIFFLKKKIFDVEPQDFLSIFLLFLTYVSLLLFNKFFPDEEIRLDLTEEKKKK